MSKFYSEPEYEIRKYSLSQGVFTTSDLEEDDVYSNTTSGNGTNSLVNDKSFA